MDRRIIMFFCGLGLSAFLEAQTPCENGMAGNYPCRNIDLMAHLTPQELGAEEHAGFYLNDIWGWTDPETGHEYALVGMTNGTSFVDISDPINPIVIGVLPEHEAASTSGRITHDGMHEGQEAKSVWRDIKTYQHYAFMVSEDPAGGMQVFDLHQLRNATDEFQVFGESAHYDGIANAHNLVINEETGFAYAVGATKGNLCAAGGLHVIDINDPLNPTYAGCFDDDGYTHDAQSVVYQGPDLDYQGKEITFNSNENTVTIVDVSDKQNMRMLSRTPYDEASYTHQGWVTEDHRYFLCNDEFDELRNKVDFTTTYIWDISDLDAPVLINKYSHARATIDHNLYIKDNVIFESNYTSGLIILSGADLSSSEGLFEQAYFDTYPADNAVEFKGTWSNYPFFESGIVVMTDMTNGLFVLKPKLDVTFAREPESQVVCAGTNTTFEVGASGQIEYIQWQVDIGNGYEDIQDNDSIEGLMSTQLSLKNVHPALDGANFRCKIVSVGGGASFSETASLGVKEMPVADFSWEIDENRVTLINLTEGDVELSWQLGYDDLMEELSTVVVHDYPDESGTYNVTLTASNECGASSKTYTIELVILGLEEVPFTIYPNPVSDVLELDYPQDWKRVRVSILTLEGKEVLTSEKTRIKVDQLQSGTYLLNVISDHGSWQQKVVVK